MTASPILDYTRRLIERRYGRSLHLLSRDTDADPVLRAVVRRYRALARADHALGARRRHLSRLLGPDADSATHTELLVEHACGLFSLAAQREVHLETLWDLLELPCPTSTSPKPAPVRRPDSSSPPDGIVDLVPLARRLAAQTSGRLTRDALGVHLRARGIAVSNQRLTDTLRYLRREARHRAT